MKDFKIRQAKPKDCAQVLSLQSSLVLKDSDLTNGSIQSRGFLIGEYKPKYFKQDAKNKIFLVAEKDTKIIGYIRIDDQPEYLDNDKKVWLAPSLKKKYFTPPHAEIGAIVVNIDFSRQDIASCLLSEAEKELKAKGVDYLFSIITVSPVTNFASIGFHEKNEFKKVAKSLPQEMFGLENYQSVLYGKKIEA